MSQSIIEKLLKGAEVKWIRLGERLKRTTGTSITAGKMKELHKSYGPLKIFGGGKTYALVNFNDIPEKDINIYPSIIVKSRGFIEFDYYNKPFSHKNELWSYHSEDKGICIKYIYYYMKTKETYFQHLGNKMQMPQISIQDTDKFPVPIPPLSIQKEIVRILDAFTAHTAELTSELNQRKKQYNYYRDKLLTFSDDEVEWKTVEEIITTVTPPLKIPRGKYKLSGNIPIVDQGENFIAGYTDNADAAIPEDEYVIFGDHTEYIKYVDFSFAQGADGLKILRPKRDLAKYVYFAFLNFYNKKGNYKRHWSDAKKTLLPIVNIKTQKRVVSILDRFDNLTNYISEGLPKEIELRNKQYEYYRDQLLNFPKPGNDAIKQSPTNL
ncbi:restriction endonuclease subunit S [Bartonella choladocola]|uniref:Type I restriction enzyme, S subunit n=1 Tax=Bartonella choladocola TaxID=2750995 RepID=A0A1U9MKR2_9HYPH|nr:restriction endonuclease subunit S [Bartonella choladocola]AQT48484.1 type I restriction enzyme, S subunit [Bartonella choladocola]